jgi:hypothetical protein
MRIAENHPTPKLGKKTIILFAHENLAFRASDFLWRVRRKTLAVVILQQGFPTQLSAKKVCVMNAKFSCAESILKVSLL